MTRVEVHLGLDSTVSSFGQQRAWVLGGDVLVAVYNVLSVKYFSRTRSRLARSPNFLERQAGRKGVNNTNLPSPLIIWPPVP